MNCMFREKKTNETIADLVKNARKEKGLSARKLATLLNVSHTEINNIESGIRVKPSIIVLKKVLLKNCVLNCSQVF